jgi:hypothetical protein
VRIESEGFYLNYKMNRLDGQQLMTDYQRCIAPAIVVECCTLYIGLSVGENTDRVHEDGLSGDAAFWWTVRINPVIELAKITGNQKKH